MSKKILFRKPRLHDYNGDITKKWYVEFSCPDPSQGGVLRRKKCYSGLHKIKDADKRREAGDILREELFQKLMNGYNPWVDDEKVVYHDALDYVFVSERKGKKATNFKTFNYYASAHIDWVKKNLAQKTLETYRSKCRIFNEWLETQDLNRYNISVIDNVVIVKFFDWLITVRNTHKNTMLKYEQILRTIFNKAVKDNLEYKNPVYDLPISKNIKTRILKMRW